MAIPGGGLPPISFASGARSGDAMAGSQYSGAMNFGGSGLGGSALGGGMNIGALVTQYWPLLLAVGAIWYIRKKRSQ